MGERSFLIIYLLCLFIGLLNFFGYIMGMRFHTMGEKENK